MEKTAQTNSPERTTKLHAAVGKKIKTMRDPEKREAATKFRAALGRKIGTTKMASDQLIPVYDDAFVDELEKQGAVLTLNPEERKKLVGSTGFLGGLGGGILAGGATARVFRSTPLLGLMATIPSIILGAKAGELATKGAVRTLAGAKSEEEKTSENVDPYVDAFQDELEKLAKAKLGSGARFKALKGKIARKGGVRDPGAVAASIGRKKYGTKRFQQLAAAGK